MNGLVWYGKKPPSPLLFDSYRCYESVGCQVGRRAKGSFEFPGWNHNPRGITHCLALVSGEKPRELAGGAGGTCLPRLKFRSKLCRRTELGRSVTLKEVGEKRDVEDRVGEQPKGGGGEWP